MYKSGSRYHVATLLVTASLICMMGCGDAPQRIPSVRRVIDDIGREVNVPVEPSRVISLAPSVTEVVFAAGVDDRLVAVTSADDYPPAVAEFDRINAFPLDHEGVVARDPDLILATDQINAVRDLEALSELGIPSYFLKFNTVTDVFTAVRKVGDLLGRSARASRAADSLESLWNDQISRVDTSLYTPSVLLLVGYDVLYAFGRDSYTNEIIEAAGGRSITAKLDGQAATLSDEFVLAEQPEFVIGTFGADFDVGRITEGHPTWDSIPAVVNGHVYSIEPDLISRPGPRVVDGARVIARWINDSRGERTRP